MFLKKKKKKAVSVLSVLFKDMYLSVYLLGLVSMLCSLGWGFGAAPSCSSE